MSTPAVSVVIPCYNLGAYLDEAVDSVLAQTFDDFEIVVVDDGWTDGPARALRRAYPRAKTSVFRTDNRGLPAARILGVKHTPRHYLCRRDGEARRAPTYIENWVAP